jgi:hypothetical protein
MQTGIKAAEKSLAATDARCRHAPYDPGASRGRRLGLGHRQRPDQTRHNQAFFTKLFPTAEWDEHQGQTVVQVAHAELTEPYAVLLADDLVTDITNEVRLIRATPSNAESGPDRPLSLTAVSNFVKMAEREGFEPSNEVSPVTRFPVAPVQPLRHLSRYHAASAAPKGYDTGALTVARLPGAPFDSEPSTCPCFSPAPP